MDLGVLKSKFIDRVYSCKKIILNKDGAIDRKETERIVSNLFDYIMLFNSDVTVNSNTILGGKSWNEIPVLNEIKDFIIPNSVRYDPSDRAWTDLLLNRIAEKEIDVKSLSYQGYIESMILFRSLFKMTISEDFCYLSDIKKDLSLADVIAKSVRDEKCIYNSTPFIPLYIKGVVELDDSAIHYNYFIDDMISDYMLSINW